MMVHRQTCQQCGSRSMRNLLVRESGHSQNVYVQCLNCRSLVARYAIAQQGYYHHGKGFESFLRGLQHGGVQMSGKNMKREFERIQQESIQSFEKARKICDELNPDDIESDFISEK